MSKDILNSSFIESPEWYPHKFDLQSGEILFHRMKRSSFSQSSFLDDRAQTVSKDPVRLPIKEVLECVSSTLEPRPIHYIFHSAYCCSTLLSRALDHPSTTLVYREPVALHQLAATRRRLWQTFTSDDKIQWKMMLDLIIQLLGRSFLPEQVIVKPTDSCNNLVTDLLLSNPDNACLLLHSDLDAFLVSTLKLPGRRSFNRGLLGRAIFDAQRFAISDIPTGAKLDDGQAAAFVWLIQMLEFSSLHKSSNRLEILDSKDLLENIPKTLQAVGKIFSLPLSDENWNETASGPVFTTHAKSQNTKETFNQASRIEEAKTTAQRFSSEIEQAKLWISPYLERLNLSPNLGTSFSIPKR